MNTHRKRKITSTVLSVMMIGSLVSQAISPIHAKEFYTSEESQPNWYLRHTDGEEKSLIGTDGNEMHGNIYKVNGVEAYCIEHGMPVDTKAPLSEGKLQETLKLSDAELEDLTIFNYFGRHNDNGSEKGTESYAIMQNYIWFNVQNTKNTEHNTNFFLRTNNHKSYASFEKEWKAIRKRTDKYKTIPSYNGWTYDYTSGTQIEIHDSNKSYSGITIENDGGLTTRVENNHIYISGKTDKDVVNFVVTKTDIPSKYLHQKSMSFVSKDTQNMGMLGMADPVSAYFTLRVTHTGKVKLTKKDNHGNYVPNTTFKVSKNADMSGAKTYKTGSDGTITSGDMTVGKYYVQEVSVPKNLRLDSTIREISIVPNETITYTATNQTKQIKIKVIKKDAKTGKTVSVKPATFEILKDNQVVSTLTTSNGEATSGLLDYGTYTIREKTAPYGYTISNITKTINATTDLYTYKYSHSNQFGI